MNDDAAQIATPEQYRAALLAVRQRMTDLHLAMLQAHCRAADHSISASRLAETLGILTPGAANLQYSKYARWIADELKFVPTPAPGNKNRWLLALAHGVPGTTNKGDGEFIWIMRPELVATLQSMRWA